MISVLSFIARSWKSTSPNFKFAEFLEVLAAKLEDVRHGRCKRLIVTMPPRHLKSLAASVIFPAWVLGHDPTKKILSVTYAQDLSDDLARKSRTLMKSPFYEALFQTRLSGREAVAEFETQAGGGRFSTSVNGVLTGRGADIIIIDDPLKADDALSETRRRGCNEWYDNTLRSRLNSQEEGAIIIVMQRLHTDDLVAHVQETETWEVVSFPVIAERDESYCTSTPYGRKRFRRREGDLLHPARLSQAKIDDIRGAMTEYNFTAQYQQNPQPAAGNIVKRDWLKFYDPPETPARFDQILQSWDTANKDSELANFSVCTTWGLKHPRMYLLDVFRRKLNFPELKRWVRELATQYQANVVLIEDKASGTSLIQELHTDGLYSVRAAPALDGDKRMRLHGQTAKIEGGFVLFPKQAAWLDPYLSELLTFPNAKNDDQVDSTVFALAWGTNRGGADGWIEFYKRENEKTEVGIPRNKEKMFKVWVPPPSDTLHLIYGRPVSVPENRIIEVTEDEFGPLRAQGARRVD